MNAPTLIDYNTFLANAQQNDVRALGLLCNGEVVKTPDAAEADGYQAIGVRLKNAGLLTRFRRSLEVINGQDWHVFDGRVDPVAITYVAQCAMERIKLSRDPIP